MSTRINTWFISDTHFGHLNIMRFCEGRRYAVGYQTVEELLEEPQIAIERHDEWLMDLWNSTVKREDFIYILGDFCLGTKEYTERLLNKLKGRKYLIRGNHDQSCKGLDNYFEWVGDIKEVKFTNNQYDFIDSNETFCAEMCHYPLLTWNRRTHGSTCLMGHCHGSIDKLNDESLELRVDVGLDANLANYNLINLETIYQYFVSLREKQGCKTFQEYAEWLMDKQGFRA